MAAPTGPKESRSGEVVAICISMIVLSCLAVAAKLWTRLRIVRNGLGADDYTIIISAAFSIAFIVDVVNQTKYGLGQHVADLPTTTNFSESLKLFYFGEAIYYIVVGTTKVSILFLYLRLATQKTYRLVIWLTMAFVICTFVSFVIAGLFQCSPIIYAWNRKIDGTCFDVTALFYANAGINIFQDVFIYILPMKMLWEVQIPRGQKIALIFVFAIGGFVCVTGMLRLNSLQTASVSKDPTWDNFGSAIWSAIESNVGIVCACLPYFKPLIGSCFPGLMGVRGNAKTSPPGHGPCQLSRLRHKHFRTLGPVNEDQLEHGMTSNDTYAGDCGDGYGYGVAISGKPLSGDSSSSEHLRGVDQEVKAGGIYKSTSMTVSHQ